jgi:hypothetical protein
MRSWNAASVLFEAASIIRQLQFCTAGVVPPAHCHDATRNQRDTNCEHIRLVHYREEPAHQLPSLQMLGKRESWLDHAAAVVTLQQGRPTTDDSSVWNKIQPESRTTLCLCPLWLERPDNCEGADFVEYTARGPTVMSKHCIRSIRRS